DPEQAVEDVDQWRRLAALRGQAERVRVATLPVVAEPDLALLLLEKRFRAREASARASEFDSDSVGEGVRTVEVHHGAPEVEAADYVKLRQRVDRADAGTLEGEDVLE